AVDYHGNILAQMNAFTTEERIMIADIPTQGIQTVYSKIGVLFTWLCVSGFVGLLVLAIINRKEK
ncbi:nitrilase, partial [Chloroflexota bacterium]